MQGIHGQHQEPHACILCTIQFQNSKFARCTASQPNHLSDACSPLLAVAAAEICNSRNCHYVGACIINPNKVTPPPPAHAESRPAKDDSPHREEHIEVTKVTGCCLLAFATSSAFLLPHDTMHVSRKMQTLLFCNFFALGFSNEGTASWAPHDK